uniref:DDE-1 domain-containing protein n=1 Tax=Phytophthora ramorum TaxID=164328 RepID=H3H659_PHYRM
MPGVSVGFGAERAKSAIALAANNKNKMPGKTSCTWEQSAVQEEARFVGEQPAQEEILVEITLRHALYSVDVQQAVLWSIESWNALLPSVFSNCWKKTGLLDYYTCEYAKPGVEDDIVNELAEMLTRLHPSNPMSVEELLNPPDENILADEPTDEDFCRVESSERENGCGQDVGDGGIEDEEEESTSSTYPTPENLSTEELKCGDGVSSSASSQLTTLR